MEKLPEITITEPSQIVPPLLPPNLCRRRSSDEDRRKIELNRLLSDHLVEIQRDERRQKLQEKRKREGRQSVHSFHWDEHATQPDPVLHAVHRLHRSTSLTPRSVSGTTTPKPSTSEPKDSEEAASEEVVSEDEQNDPGPSKRTRRFLFFFRRSSYSP